MESCSCSWFSFALFSSHFSWKIIKKAPQRLRNYSTVRFFFFIFDEFFFNFHLIFQKFIPKYETMFSMCIRIIISFRTQKCYEIYKWSETELFVRFLQLDELQFIYFFFFCRFERWKTWRIRSFQILHMQID